MKLSGRIFAIFMVAGLALAGGPAVADDDHDDHDDHKDAKGVVKDRMELMEDFGKEVKKISTMLKGEKEFKAKEVAEKAHFIAIKSGGIPALFPKGSLEKPSEALPAIWEQPDTFKSRATDFATKAGALAAAADAGDRKAIEAAFAEMGKACGACHTDFRKKKEKKEKNDD